MSRCTSNPPPQVQNNEILIDEPSNEQKDSSFPSQPNQDLIEEGSVPMLMIGKNEGDDIEDEESEFKMGKLIRQASLNSSHMSTQKTTKLMRARSGLPRYLSQKLKTNQEKVMNEGNRNKRSMKIVKNIDGGAPAIPGGCVDNGSSEDMKEQIKFWARSVAFNLHQEC